jgi:uncharacterized delta-60 repeat protein
MSKKILLKFGFICCLFFTSQIFAQDGSLDNTFDSDGLVTSTIGTFDDAAYALALKEDPLNPTNFAARKIIIAGHTYNGNNYDFLLMQYNSDGSIDNNFGVNGVVTLSIGNYDDKARTLAIQSDGKIVVAGNSFDGSKDDFALARFNADGSIDNTFNGNGFVLTSIGTVGAAINSIAIQSDGSIFAAGYTLIGSNMDFAVAKYNSSGILDNTFDTDGIAITPFYSNAEYASKVLIQSDGKIVVLGSTVQNSDYDFAMVRYNPDGTYDNTFNSNGFITPFFSGNFNEYGNTAILQNDGKILMAGMNNSTFNDFIVGRINTDGSMDNSFGSNGFAVTDFGTSTDYGEAIDMTIQPDNKVIVAGLRNVGVALDFAVARYDQNGALDASFDTDGMLNTNFGGDDQGRATIMQSDGKILVAGSSHDGTQNRVALARYNNPSVSTTTALQQNNLNRMQVVPNPFKNYCTIIAEDELKNANLSIYNNQGMLCYTQNKLNGKSINLQRNNLAAGVYFVKIIDEGQQVLIQKLVVGE